MDSKIILESFLSAIDIGVVFESMNNYRKRSWQVDLGEIIKYMIIGKGYTHLTPPQTSRLLLENKDNVRIVDLRETETYEKNHINGSISRPIDDFLKEIFEGTYSSSKTDLKIVLVCDTGQLSKVAAAIMIEEGFTQVYSIKGGMRRWNRWMKLSRKMLFSKIASCCTQVP
ncbi:MAG: rhodanese-like domain-containing protein [Deltaproteobacteria bacterium]|nr:rhodanese-like domain-containing protein [Deltaproteobacteria bacterium]MBW2157782.1 rhodanese-like domain-containing protein [Deltaproteobacteria bacterium]